VLAGPSASPVAEDISESQGVEVFRVDAKDGRLDLHQVVKAFGGPRHHAADGRGRADRCGRVPGGHLVDDAALFRSPHEIGMTGISVLEGPAAHRADAVAKADEGGKRDGRGPIVCRCMNGA